jgi:ribose-phosphate pyrophosphokinase
MMIKIYNDDFKLSRFKFSGGELQVRVAVEGLALAPGSVTLSADLHSSDDIMELILTVDALRRELPAGTPFHLVCPYLPYARQDRVCAPGEALSVSVMTDLINLCGFHSVKLWDVHSDVSLALLRRVINVHQKDFVSLVHWDPGTILVAPDAGARKKTAEVAKLLGLQMITADKTRSVETGAITSTVVHFDGIPVEELAKKDFLIVDDICDGGRTFIELAKVLRPWTTGKIYLYVTHGIFSNGLDVFNSLIDGVYTANPFPKVDLNHKLLTVVSA